MDGMLEVLRLINCVGEVKGRKKLQKLVHILRSQGYKFPQDFGYLHYGPYSSGLAAQIDSLVSSDLVTEDGGGEQYEPYVYKIGPTASKLLRDLGKSAAPAWQDLARTLNRDDANCLEALSTVLYLRSNGFSGRALRDRFSSLKPNLRRLFDDSLKRADSLPKAH